MSYSNSLLHCRISNSCAIEHLLRFACAGFLSLRHSGVCDVTAQLLTEMFGAEPTLKPLDGEQFNLVDVCVWTLLQIVSEGKRGSMPF